ncbi:unnamed protein product [Polarella glacialis]|uniref:Uncharacterized protein n=1 Tax=Polarella glacialis TaxID=89957 RepID=A0A813G8R0_POLGL|nr:unnamed protein product [Polarella glacialis]
MDPLLLGILANNSDAHAHGMHPLQQVQLNQVLLPRTGGSGRQAIRELKKTVAAALTVEEHRQLALASLSSDEASAQGVAEAEAASTSTPGDTHHVVADDEEVLDRMVATIERAARELNVSGLVPVSF